MYILWSPKMQGWLSLSGNYTTDQEQARQFDRPAALVQCKRFRTNDSHGLLPVSLDDMAAI